MAEVVWRPEALDHLDEIAAYLEQFDPAAAERIRTRLRQIGESLSDFPSRGRPGPGGTRELPTVSPYVLSYAVEDDVVFILRIRHSARRPLA